MLYAHCTTNIVTLQSFIARCCFQSPAAQALTGVFRFTRAYDEEDGTEDTNQRATSSPAQSTYTAAPMAE